MRGLRVLCRRPVSLIHRNALATSTKLRASDSNDRSSIDFLLEKGSAFRSFSDVLDKPSDTDTGEYLSDKSGRTTSEGDVRVRSVRSERNPSQKGRRGPRESAEISRDDKLKEAGPEDVTQDTEQTTIARSNPSPPPLPPIEVEPEFRKAKAAPGSLALRRHVVVLGATVGIPKHFCTESSYNLWPQDNLHKVERRPIPTTL